MTIHHAQIKKAEKMGVQLEEAGDYITAFWPKRALKIYGTSAGDAIAQMQAAIAIAGDDTYRIVPDMAQPRLVNVYDGDLILQGGPMPPVAAHKLLIIDRKGNFLSEEDNEVQNELEHLSEGSSAPKDDKVERINGVAIDGAIAYSEGTPAGDCPYSSEEPEGEDEDSTEYDNFVRWNDEWDAAADEAGEEKEGGSVVAEKYRAKYAEMGHPTHCGDWLAETLNEICLNKGGTNLELFEEICLLNGVDTSKYKRTGVGWQGRIRMTGRNLMAKKVYQNEGRLILPQTLHGGMMKAPGEWMEMQRYKALPKADAKPTGEVIALKSK